jgi:hypothetical protein
VVGAELAVVMPRKQTHVFVSYSHADSSLVAPIVKLLRLNKSPVFQDIDGIQPGKKWRHEIDTALIKSQLVVVFWCHHADQSDEVSKEWKAAIAYKKNLLPLLFDHTPLPQELSEFQWIDFREMVGTIHVPEPDPPLGEDLQLHLQWGLTRSVPLSVKGMWLLVLGYLSIVWFIVPASKDASYELFSIRGILAALFTTIVVIIAVVLVVMVLVATIRLMLSRLRIRIKSYKFNSEVAQPIAAKLEAEILQRIASMSIDDA